MPSPRLLLTALTALTTAFVALTAVPALGFAGAPAFQASRPYTGNFPDPDVLRVGTTYYAYATATGGANVPVETSTDLVHWTARGDALPRPAGWGVTVSPGPNGKRLWAPGVERIGGRYVLYYAVQTRLSPSRFCISLASSASPLGPFVDGSRQPLVCSTDPAGSIDPDPFVDPTTGKAWLMWKNEGVPHHAPTVLWSRQLDATGHFAAGSVPYPMLRTSQAWEGNLIEGPSMVRWAGSYWLFYSANEWASRRYATGYARCSGPAGPCARVRASPLLASSGAQLGPGGPSPFVDAAGRLRLAYHSWNAPYTSYPAYPACLSTSSCTTQGQRRLAVRELVRGGPGLLPR